jgi:hypothetical protein
MPIRKEHAGELAAAEGRPAHWASRPGWALLLLLLAQLGHCRHRSRCPRQQRIRCAQGRTRWTVVFIGTGSDALDLPLGERAALPPPVALPSTAADPVPGTTSVTVNPAGMGDPICVSACKFGSDAHFVQGYYTW